MGAVSASCSAAWHNRMGWGSVPDTERATYFPEQLMMGWFELLCCPSAMGATIVNFEPKNPSGGEPHYKIKLRLSHSEHVPRYQLHVVRHGKTKQWVVGHMEKTETHLRAKPGEFVRVQVWKLTCNAIVMEARRSALQRKSRPCMNAVRSRPTPSATDMQVLGLAITTQAKLDQLPKRPGDLPGEPAKFDKGSEKWVQTMGVDNRAYKLAVEPPRNSDKMHKSIKSMNVLRALYRGRKVCVARKQRFAGTIGQAEQPYLGVQIKPTEVEAASASSGPREVYEEDGVELESLLDTSGLMLLLLCLAWSEETMSPQTDLTNRFIEAMRADAGAHGSASELGLSVQWDTDDVRQRLKHVDFARFHTWGEQMEKLGDSDDEEMSDDEDLRSVPASPSGTPSRGVSFHSGKSRVSSQGSE